MKTEKERKKERKKTIEFKVKEIKKENDWI